MLKGACDIFALVGNVIHNDCEVKHITTLFNDWEVKHVTIQFEMIDTSGIGMAPKLQELLDRFALIDKIIIYVNDEGSNLQTCAW